MTLPDFIKKPENLSPREQKTRNIILAYASNVFQERGFRKVTVEEICSAVGVSKRTFYKYFKNRDELVKAVLAETLREVGPKIVENLLSKKPVDEIIETHFQLLVNDLFGKVSTQMMADIQLLMPDLWEQIETFRNGIVRMLVGQLKRGQAEGVIRPEVDAETLGKIVPVMVSTMANPGFLLSHGLTIQQLANTMPRILIHGVLIPDRDKESEK